MQIEYKITTHDDRVLRQFWKDGWQLIQILDWKMYWSRELKQTKTPIKWKETKERKEFIEFYRKNITNKWSYWDPVIRKYEIALESTPHKTIMDNLKDYKLFLEINKTRPPLQVTTYINQKRYFDKWEIVKDMSRKFINDIFKEKQLNADEIEFMTKEIETYEKTQNREASDYNVRAIIKKYLNK